MPSVVTKTIPAHQGSQVYLKSKHYRATKQIQENQVLNRAILDLGSGFVPVFLVELLGRNWQTAVETLFGNVLRLFTNYAAPLGLVPVFNNISGKRNNLPDSLDNLFSVQFEDLTPDTNVQAFRKKLFEIVNKKGHETIKKMSDDELSSLKRKLLDAKSFVRKLDLMSVGFLTYSSPWIRNLFTKSILRVSGYPGELGVLGESEREQSASIHERFGLLKFASGLLFLFLGSHWDAEKFKKAVSLPKEETGKDMLLNHMRGNMKNFDYYKGYITKRGNIFRHNLYGGITSRLLASRSINEIIERLITMVISLTGNFWGDLIAHNTLARNHDKKYETKIISHSKDGLNGKKVKPLSLLENELEGAVKKGNDDNAVKLLESIKGQIKTYYQSMGLTALVMGVVTAFRIWNTKRRAAGGKY